MDQMTNCTSRPLDRILALEAVRVTEAAAIRAATAGRPRRRASRRPGGRRRHARGLQPPAHRGRGRDRRGRARRGADALHRRSWWARGGIKVDIALDPLEGTTLTAKGLPNALAVMAMAEAGTLLNAPDVYMDKIAIGPGYQGRRRSISMPSRRRTSFRSPRPRA